MQFKHYIFTFATGAITATAAQYFIPYLKGKAQSDTHSFNEFINKKSYSQPNVIDLLHAHPNHHFLHNFIVRNNVFNIFKVYYPHDIESHILKGSIKDQNIDMNIVFNAHDSGQGHSKIVHGGLIATVFDNAFGQVAVLKSGMVPVATANLNVNYKKPIKVGHDYMMNCFVEKHEGRKIFVKGIIVDQDHNVVSDATALMIQVKWGTSFWKDLIFGSQKPEDSQIQKQQIQEEK